MREVTQGTSRLLSQRYLPERAIGRGGFATVWAARDLLLDRPVALKIMHESIAREPESVARFVQEALLASRFLHETIVRVEAIDRTEQGVPYLVMELLEGRTLQRELKQGRLPLGACLEVARLLLEGLAAAHRQQIAHRDVKPSNVFLLSDGRPGPPIRLLDFGLAKDLGDPRRMTREGFLIGTPDFVAPELYRAGQRPDWPAADVFSCGVVLFELLTGRRPLDGLVRERHVTEAFLERARFYRLVPSLVGPAEVEPGVPLGVDWVVRRALSIDPARRFRDAGEMLLALGAVLDDLGREARAPRRVEARVESPLREPDFDSCVTAVVPRPSWGAGAGRSWRDETRRLTCRAGA